MPLKRSLRNKKILITSGPTWVPIDAVRVVSNQSTGTLGRIMARDFANAGARVTLLEGPVTQSFEGPKSIRVLKFAFFDELAALIKKELKKKYDVCVHAAAVSDYKLKKPARIKLSSQFKRLRLELVPTPKIIYAIKKFNPRLFLIGFKLETRITGGLAVKKSRILFQKGRCDLVAANSLRGRKYSGYILDKNKTLLAQARSRRQLSKALIRLLQERL